MNTVILWNGNDRKKGGNMKQWEVLSNYVGGETVYQVARIRDEKEVRHAGNFDFDGIYDTLEAAQMRAEILNIREALANLGHDETFINRCMCERLDDSRVKITCDEEYIGIYDFSKQTFVD